MSTWQPIETAPMGVVVLVHVPGDGVLFGLSERLPSGNLLWDCYGVGVEVFADPTHWMPLPANPVAP